MSGAFLGKKRFRAGKDDGSAMYEKIKEGIRQLWQKKKYKALSEVHRVFSQEKISYFVDFGTLLAMIREKDFLMYDSDLDFGILPDSPGEEVNYQLVRRELKEAGFRHLSENIFKGKVIKDRFIFSGVRIDFFYYKQEGNLLKCWLFYKPPRDKLGKEERRVVEVRHSTLTGLKKIKVRGVEFFIPENPERVLAEKYGEGWRIPDRKWVYWKAPNACKCEQLGFQRRF